MTFAEVEAAYAAKQKVRYHGQPVTIIKPPRADAIWVAEESTPNKRIQVTAAELSPV